MPPSIQDLLPLAQTLSPAELDALFSEIPYAERVRMAEEVIQIKADLRKTRQIQFYEMVNPDALPIHLATEKECVIRGGNRSSKSDSILADAVICMTGIVPFSLEHVYPKEKLRCPMRVRLVCESITNTWDTVIKPKLQWNRWNGPSAPGGLQGHWGWIPQSFLLRGKWEDSWREKDRVLTLTCGCTWQVMSNDQDIENFTGDSLHRIIHDEPPRPDIYEENLMRVIDVKGQIYSGFTPSNDPNKALRGAWIYEIFERGEEGPGKDPDVRAVVLHTENNKILDRAEIEKSIKGLSAQERMTRLHGEFFHLTGRIYPNYTDRAQWWCFHCNGPSMVTGEKGQRKTCATCGNDNVADYCNFVEPFDQAYTWPVIYCLDPHPRKPNMMMWMAIDPADDLWQLGEMEVDGDPATVRTRVKDYERSLGLNISGRLIDPNMAESAAHQAGRRHVSVRDEYDAVGLRCALANDSFTVGMKRVRELIRPDERTKTPRLHVFNTCHLTNKQAKNYCFDEQTELLTPGGWTNIASIGAAQVATLNSIGDIEFQKPFDYIENKYSGPMVQIKSRVLDLFVTPEHRMLVRPSGKPDRWGFTLAEKLSKQHMVMCAAPVTAQPTWRSPFDHLPNLNEEDWAEFIGWYCSEGYSISRNEPLVGICQTPKGAMDELHALLKKMPWQFNYIDGSRSFVCYDPNLWAFFHPMNGAFGKMLPREVFSMSLAAKRRCLNSLILGDGCIERNGAIVYHTVSRQLSEDVAELMNHVGLATGAEFRQAQISYLQNGKEIRGSGMHVVRGRTLVKASLRSGDGVPKFKTVDDYAGIVRCVSVPNGTLLARRNHRPIITGNCWAEWSHRSELSKDAKAVPITKNDDMVTMWRYIALSNPTYRGATQGTRPMRATRAPRPRADTRAHV